MKVGFGNDSVVVRTITSTLEGGRVLDMTGFEGNVVEAGHVIIKNTLEGTYKPMPVSGGAYSSLPGGYEYVGILISSVTKADPFAAILNAGQVCEPAMPYALGAIKASFKQAVPTIVFFAE